jgi:hypothetical protein
MEWKADHAPAGKCQPLSHRLSSTGSTHTHLQFALPQRGVLKNLVLKLNYIGAPI